MDYTYEAMQKNQRGPNLSVRLKPMLEAAKFINIQSYEERYQVDPDIFADQMMTSLFPADDQSEPERS